MNLASLELLLGWALTFSAFASIYSKPANLLFIIGKGVSLAILVALTMTLAISLKNQIARPRPTPTTEVALSQGSERSLYGMPSSHAVFFALMAGVAGARWHRWGVRVIAASVALGLGMIRVAKGLHYPTDVLAGWGLGLACGTLGWLAIKNAFSAKTRSADIQSVQ